MAACLSNATKRGERVGRVADGLAPLLFYNPDLHSARSVALMHFAEIIRSKPKMQSISQTLELYLLGKF